MSSPSPIPFGPFAEEIRIHYSSPRYSRATRLRIHQVLRELAELKVRSTADLTTKTMTRYILKKGEDANPNTVNGLLGVIRSLVNYAIEEGYLDRGPSWRRLWLPARPMTKNMPRRYEEVSRLLAHLHQKAQGSDWEDRRICAVTWFFALTAVRLQEGLRAFVEDLDLDRCEFHVRFDRQEDKRLKTPWSDRIVPLPDVLTAVLRGWVPHAGPGWLFPGVRRMGPWTGGSDTSRAIGHLKLRSKEVGIDQITWHSLRHAYGTFSLERWDVPQWVVQQVMGHKDARTTERYLHLIRSPKVAESCKGISYRITG